MNREQPSSLAEIKPNIWAIGLGIAIPLCAILWYIPIFSAQLAVMQPVQIDISASHSIYTFTWERYINTLFNSDHQWTRIVGLGAIPNGIICYLLLQKQKMSWAMGMFYGSLIVLAIVGVMRFL